MFITIKKIHTHVEKVGTSQNFCLVIIDELEKQLFIKKLLKLTNKKYKNFNIYNLVFKKIKKSTKGYHYFTPLYQKS